MSFASGFGFITVLTLLPTYIDLFDPSGLVAFGLLTVLLGVALVGVWCFTDPDETRVAGFAFTDFALNRRILTLASFRP